MGEAASKSQVFNVPNQITLTRLVLSIVVFALIGWEAYLAAMIIFIIAASTDWVDGYWARKHNLVTQLGRILDPFVDKIIICGTFIYLAATPESGIVAWMAVVVVGRELLVTVLRSLIEQHGGDFSASWAGKWKMVLQCVAVAVSLLVLVCGGEQAATWLRITSLLLSWSAIGLTVYSGVDYVFAAIRMFKDLA